VVGNVLGAGPVGTNLVGTLSRNLVRGLCWQQPYKETNNTGVRRIKRDLHVFGRASSYLGTMHELLVSQQVTKSRRYND